MPAIVGLQECLKFLLYEKAWARVFKLVTPTYMGVEGRIFDTTPLSHISLNAALFLPPKQPGYKVSVHVASAPTLAVFRQRLKNFLFPTKTLSFDSCVTITIHHYCLDTRGSCNN